MFRTALRTVLAHKARLSMTVLAVMLGVAFVSGTLVFGDTLTNAFRNQSTKSYSGVAVSVTAGTNDPKKPGLDQQTLDKITALEGVAGAHGRVEGFAGVSDPDGELLGDGLSNKGSSFAPGKDGDDPAYTFTKGSGPVRDDQVALDERTASKGGYEVGERVRVATRGPVSEYTLSGVFTTEDGAVNAGGSLVLFDAAVAQEKYLEPGYFESAIVTADPGASDSQILADVLNLLPDAQAETGEDLAQAQAETTDRGMETLQQVLLAFAGIALFVGVFLISNTFTMLVAQRTREIAMLRAVGATRKQVTRSVLIEAALVGLVAAAVGFGLGAGLAAGLHAGMGAFDVPLPAGPLVLSAMPVLASLVIGVLITMLAAWLPGRRAAKIPPVAAMNSVHAAATTKSLRIRNSIGAAVTALGAFAIVAGVSSGDNGKEFLAAGAFFALVGVIILIPLLSRPVIRLARPLLDGPLGVAGKLAGLNAVRNPRRTGATASALAIGLTLVTGLSVVGVTVGEAIDKATTDNIRADYMITMANGDDLDPSSLKALQNAEGVTAVSPQHLVGLQVGQAYETASAIDPSALQQVLNIDVVSGDIGALEGDHIAISTETAEENGLRPGDSVPVVFEDGKEDKLTVSAVYRESRFSMPVLIDAKVVAPHQLERLIREIYVKTEGGESPAAKQALVDALGNNPVVQVMDHDQIRQKFTGAINTMLNIMYGLLAMSLIIAVLGVVNTLAMSVFERQQEIGMLRAIGLDRSKVKRMVRLEAVIISLFGAVVGIVLGSFLGWAVGTSIAAEIPEYELVMPWGRIAVFLMLAGLVGTLAAMWPARSAAKLNILSAIKGV